MELETKASPPRCRSVGTDPPAENLTPIFTSNDASPVASLLAKGPDEKLELEAASLAVLTIAFIHFPDQGRAGHIIYCTMSINAA